MNEKVLVVDDEEDIVEFVKFNLEKEGFDVITAENGEKCLKAVELHSPELIILDLMMPVMDGLEVCRRLKRDDKTKKIPVIMLTAKSAETDVVVGLEMGADDYVVKPFSPRVLTARVKSVLRRCERKDEDSDIITKGAFYLNSATRQFKLDGEEQDLTFSEFEILKLLISHPGRVYTRKQIMKSIRDDEYFVTERAIDVQIVSLRKKLGEYDKTIKTVRGVGYKFNG